MTKQGASSVIWREAIAVIRRYPLATLIPAAVLGTLGEAPVYFIEDRPVLDQVVTYLTAAFAYYLYLAYAEQVSAEAERGVDRITLRDMLHLLRQAMPFVPRVLVAASVSFSISNFATGLLVLPGAWLFTRWSLSTPVISNEDLGPVAALKRSNEIVRGHFWFIFKTATLAFVLEEVVAHTGEWVGLLVTGSNTWGEWIGGSIPASLIMPLAALTTSIAYVRLTTCAQPLDRV
ncbi:MAG: hypothetical protein QOI57_1937 [Rubrobacteraceae bacterium]|nr:hypothetical protein [Rubrobacteraceae bacterium]